MRCVDVNVLVYAHRPESDRHERYRSWLDDARRGREPLGVPDVVVAGFLRVTTHPRVFQEPTPLEVSLAFIDSLREGPASTPLVTGERHWQIFAELCRASAATGNRIFDAYLAALAIEHDATLITADRGFGRYPGLRWRHPLDA